jgi:hypothetical protein
MDIDIETDINREINIKYINTMLSIDYVGIPLVYHGVNFQSNRH